MTPTLVAPACLATLANASCAVRSSANSASGVIGRAVPVVVTRTVIPCSFDHLSATSASASLRRPPSSGSGRSASTERRASARLSLASLLTASKGRTHGGGTSCICSAACSCAMIPVSPWARVSWISRAIRWRSSRTPASRAWASSWACRPVFSASVASSSRFVRLSSARVCSRCSFSRSARRSTQAVPPMRTTLAATMDRYSIRPEAVVLGTSDACAVPATTATAATPDSRHGQRRTVKA